MNGFNPTVDKELSKGLKMPEDHTGEWHFCLPNVKEETFKPEAQRLCEPDMARRTRDGRCKA